MHRVEEMRLGAGRSLPIPVPLFPCRFGEWVYLDSL